MARKNVSGVTPSVINEWLNRIDPETGKRYSQAAIGAKYGVTQQHISWVKHNHPGVSETLEERVASHFPWNVSEYSIDMARSNPARMLRAHIRYQITAGKGMSTKLLGELRSFYNRLIREDVVVEFDPDAPPSDGVYYGGWAFPQRLASDDDLIIRLNKYARSLGPESLVYWGFPEVLPGDS